MSLTLFEIISVVLGITTIILAVVGWLFNRLLNQRNRFAKEKADLREEIESQKDRAEQSAFLSIAEKIEGLVLQVTDLFSGQREINADISHIREEVGDVKADMGKHLAKCDGREQQMLDIKARQDKGLERLAIIDRKGDPKREDRCDRES